MVKKLGLLALLAPGILLANDGYVSADKLRMYLKDSEQQKLSASERLKASRANSDSIRLLNEKDLYFKLPNGSYVTGMLLSNGKLSPALNINGLLVPACVTLNNKLIPGRWDPNHEVIECHLAQNQQFAMLEDAGIYQRSPHEENEDSTPLKSQATKYNNVSPEKNVAAPKANKASKYNQGSANSSQQAKAENQPEYIYSPPQARGSTAKTVAGVLDRDHKAFGIPVGTWVKARLMRPVSSAERGLIEFEITEPIFGKYRDLPASTVLFARKFINEAEEKMESITVNARLPDGEEIPITATIHSMDQTAGLYGKLVRDREGEVLVASSQAALDAITSLSPAAKSTPGRALNSITGTLIDNESDYLPERPKAVIRVAEQTCLLKITKTF